MTRSQRLTPIQQIFDRRERQAASQYGASLSEKQKAQKRLAELKNYRQEYTERLTQQRVKMIDPIQIREYQRFLDNLEIAIEEQEKLIAQLDEACVMNRDQWATKYQRQQALNSAVNRLEVEEQNTEAQQEQKAADERSQRRSSKIGS